MRRSALLAATAFLLVLAAPLLADEAADRLIERGDRFYESRGKGVKWCAKAIECYEKALALDPQSVAASWRFARASYFLGMHTDGDDRKLEVYQRGIDVAKRAVAIDEKSVESHFWLGVSYGKWGETNGPLNSLSLVEPIRKEMQRVLELDEKFEGGGAHRVLGRLYYKLPGIAGGDNAKAIEHLEKAVEIDGSRLLNRLFLAEVYVAEDQAEKAKEQLAFILEAPFEEGRQPENEEEKALAKEMLEELED